MEPAAHANSVGRGKNEGKSGGFRVITYYPGADRVYLIDVFAKNEKSNLSKAERNLLKKITAELE